MSIQSHVFAATWEELRAAFPDRVPPDPKPRVEELADPTTGAVEKVWYWVPGEEVPEWVAALGFPTAEELAAIGGLAGAGIADLDLRQLCALRGVARGRQIDIEACLDELARPVLIAPGDEQSRLFAVPDDIAGLLGGDRDRDQLAEAWAATTELTCSGWTAARAREILADLEEVAAAAGPGRALYLWLNIT